MTNLVHGDSTEVNWSTVTDGYLIDCVITDPPFGVNYESRRGKTADHDKYMQAIDNDASIDDAIPCFLDAIANMQRLFADQCEMYVFTRWDILPEWIAAVSSIPDFTYKMLLVWDKGALGMGDIDCSWGASHELILYAKKGRREMNFQRSSVLRFDRPPASQRIHPTEKPASLLEVLIKNSTLAGDVVADPFAGSGSTLAAAQATNRTGVGVEKDLKFFSLASTRLDQPLLFT